MIQKSTQRIVATSFCPGRVHDFALFKQSALAMHKDTLCLADRGYLGLQKQHENTLTPHKRTKKKPLTPLQKQQNKQLSRERLDVEHIIGWLKRFRLLCGPYRNRRKRLGLRFNLIAALYNAHLDL